MMCSARRLGQDHTGKLSYHGSRRYVWVPLRCELDAGHTCLHRTTRGERVLYWEAEGYGAQPWVDARQQHRHQRLQ